MSRREQAIKDTVKQMHGAGMAVWAKALSDLIDQAEAGKLKEPIARSYAGINGLLTVYPDGREERS